MADFERTHQIYGDARLRSPMRQRDLGYDLINPLTNYDFPLNNVHLAPTTQTFPQQFHTTNTTTSTNTITQSTLSPIDLEHRHLLPSQPIQIESPLHVGKLWNPAPIALPYNPLGYRYLMTRRALRGKLFEEEEAHHDWVEGGSSQLTCFSDWFPIDLIQEQDQEQLKHAKKWRQEHPDQTYFENPRQYGPFKPKHPLEADNERLLRVVINTTRIDQDVLANYYGYDNYNDMPFHPRIPTKTTNTTWTHRCITPWRNDDGGYLNQNYYKIGLYGPEDTRLTYDRCGRLLLYFGSANDHSPFFPTWSLKILDARVFESNEMLFRPLSDFCPLRHYYPDEMHLIDGGVEGHLDNMIKNWNLLPYGHSANDMQHMLKLKLEFIQAASIYDFRTNSLLLTNSNYLSLYSKFAPKPTQSSFLIPPWVSPKRELTTTKNTLQSPIINYLRSKSTFLTDYSPLSFHSGSVESFEKLPTNKQSILSKCFISLNQYRQSEFSHPFLAKKFHATANSLLIYISPEDWAEDPFLSITPVEKRPNWVYFGVGNDRSHQPNPDTYGPWWLPVYRPFITMIDAETLELIAIRPFITTLPNKCREKQYDETCRYGVGSNCHELCAFIYLHYLTVIQTPLTYSILSSNPSTNSTANPPKTAHDNFNPSVYDRLYSNGGTIHNNQYNNDSNTFFQSILKSNNNNVQPTAIPINPNTIPASSSVPDFVNPPSPFSSTSTSSSTPKQLLSSNSTLQGLHFTLPTYYTLDTQVFAVLNSLDTVAWFQELDLKAFWRQRHPCNIPLSRQTYPHSIPPSDVTIPTGPAKLTQPFTPYKQEFDVYDWMQIDNPPIVGTPFATPQQNDIAFLPSNHNFDRYVNIDQYSKRAHKVWLRYIIPLLAGFGAAIIFTLIGLYMVTPDETTDDDLTHYNDQTYKLVNNQIQDDDYDDDDDYDHIHDDLGEMNGNGHLHKN